jgi:hypothetical protein
MIIYTGAFISIIKIPNLIEEIEEEEFEYPQCKKKCGDHAFLTRSAKFCPMCGNPIKLIKRTIQVPHVGDMADISELLDGHDLEWCNGWGMENRAVDKILIPSYSGKWGQRYDVDYDGLVDKIPSGTGYKAVFEKKWAKSLRVLEEKEIKFRVNEGMVVFEQD